MILGNSANSPQVPHGGDIYTNDVRLDLSVNMNPLGCPDIVLDAVGAANKRLSCYPEYDYGGLRNAAGKCYGVPAGCVVCGSGVSELLSAIGRLYRGCRVLMPVPCFTGYERGFRESDIRFYYLREQDFFGIGRGILDEIGNADALIFGNPNNPTGRLADRGLLMEMLDAAKCVGCRVIVDESFIELGDIGEDGSLVRVLPDYPNLVVLRSITKSYAAAGVRLGFALGGDADYLARLSRELPEWAVSVYAEEIGKALLSFEGRAEYLKKSLDAVGRYRSVLEGKLRDAGIYFIPSECNFVLMKSERNLYQEMLHKKVLIRDCGNIRGLGKGWYRMATLEGVSSIVF